MKIKLERINDAFHMRSTNESGQSVDADGSPAIGGENKGMRPMEMFLSSLASCSTIDIILLLKKQRQQLEHIEVEVEGKRREGQIPAVFTDIHLHYILHGDLDPKKAERACRISVEELCSVSKMIEKTVNITWEFSIRSTNG
jgi:putative redox protein